MPAFVYLPGRKLWVNLQHVVDVTEGTNDGNNPILDIRMSPDGEGSVPSWRLYGPDRDVLLKTLSKLTPKELT